MKPLSVLGPLTRFAGGSGSGPERRRGPKCELCAGEIGGRHRHVADLEAGSLACACTACALLFEVPEAGGGHYRTVPDRVLHDPSFEISKERWATLDIPVELAFIFYSSSVARWVGFYPSPAGAVEAELDPTAWDSLLFESPLAADLAPDVEALLVFRQRGRDTLDSLLVPIDACYQLVAEVRRRWRGFGGGDDVKRAIEESIEQLTRRSRPFSSTKTGGRR